MPAKHSHQSEGFFKGRFQATGTAIKGAYLILTTEHSIMVQSSIALIFSLLGFYYGLNTNEWIFHILVWTMVLATETLNTAVEKLCDFVHEDYHDKIGFVKDISAGAVTFTVIATIIVELIIFTPYF